MKKCILIVSGFFLFSCVSNQSKNDIPDEPKKPSAQAPSPVSKETTDQIENIDQQALQDFLKLKREYNNLGYFEKSYNTCEVGFGYSPTKNCRQKTFVVIQFQLMCRDSEGTINRPLTQNDLKPISRQNIKWTLKNASGQTQSDSEGYAEIAMISNISQRTQRLKLSVGNDFLFLRAGEITQMITPKSWCQ